MTLRIMLLGLVASMGFELPSGSDLTRWADSGRGWVNAQMADHSGPCVEAVRPDVLPTDCLQAKSTCHDPVVVTAERPNSPEDQAFAAISQAMAADFVADLVAQAGEPRPSEPETLIVALPETSNIGLPAGEELASQVVAEAKELEKVDVVDVIAEPTPTVEVNEGMQERLDRISSAVRLTREAVQAWAEVIQDPADEAGLTR